MPQQLLFPDPQPLIERLGRDFFRGLPELPGVYVMRDATDTALYVGKAKNLRQRLNSYRVANPDRMPRRHLRLLRAVVRIEIQKCSDEQAALAHEAGLLRTLRPCFNRAGTWPASPKFLAWKFTGEGLDLAVISAPDPEWRLHGPMGASARHVRRALVRVLWSALCPARGISQMPAGWFRGFGDRVTIPISPISATPYNEISSQLETLFAGQTNAFGEWIAGKLVSCLPQFEKAVIDADIEYLENNFSPKPKSALPPPPSQ